MLSIRKGSAGKEVSIYLFYVGVAGEKGKVNTVLVKTSYPF